MKYFVSKLEVNGRRHVWSVESWSGIVIVLVMTMFVLVLGSSTRISDRGVGLVERECWKCCFRLCLDDAKYLSRYLLRASTVSPCQVAKYFF